MKNNFCESHLEEATLEWFADLGYEVIFAPDIAPDGEYPERSDYSEVILPQRVKDALFRINKGLPAEAIEDAYRQIAVPNSPNLLVNNKAFQKMITDGIDVSYRLDSGEVKYTQAHIFDFEKPLNNDFVAVNQFTVVENRTEKRPDVIIFVNGLPLVVIELKSASNEEVNITDAYNQLQTYKQTIPSLFTFNSFMVISDGINARAGTLTSDEERFMAWRTIEGDEVAPLSVPQLEVLIMGMFKRERFLDIIKQFILFQSDGKDTFKILAGYHQYHAVNKAVENTIRATKEKGDRRIGVVWHTQGSGKSLSMVFYAGKLVINEDLGNPTIVVITDRNDLDDQLFSTFAKCKDFLRSVPQQAENREHLRELLNNRTSGGIIFTTIQKFAPEDRSNEGQALTDRKNVVVMADEAHRSQYGFGADVVKEDEGASLKYGYAKYMRDSLPNASYIGFTGTPVELTDKNTR
ncbi:MAG: HsdR family type I site-specific deoxyribonuclease, partial [Anaerovoracaceae bacterium]